MDFAEREFETELAQPAILAMCRKAFADFEWSCGDDDPRAIRITGVNKEKLQIALRLDDGSGMMSITFPEGEADDDARLTLLDRAADLIERF